MNGLRAKLSLVVVLLLGLVPAYSGAAQDNAATPVPDSAPVGVLAEFEIDEVANPHAEVWFMRAQLEPDGSLPLGVQNGQTVLYVESGTLQVEAEVFVVGGETNEAGGPDVTLGTWSTSLDVGGSLMVTRNTDATLRNTSGETTTFLILFMYPAMEEGQNSQLEEPVGLTQTGLSIGAAEFYPAPATVVVERVVVEPGESLQNVTLPAQGEEPDPGWMGIDLGTIETGSADLEFAQRSYETITWLPMVPDEFPQPEQVELTGTTSLEQGESYSAFGSVITVTNTGEEPLTILRVIVTPHMGP